MSRIVGPAEVVSKYIAPRPSRHLAASFDDVESSGAILVFDEADGLFGKRDEIDRHDGPVVLGVRSMALDPGRVAQEPRRREGAATPPVEEAVRRIPNQRPGGTGGVDEPGDPLRPR